MGTQMILGILIRAKDQASMAMGKVEKSFKSMGDTGEEAAAKFQKSAKMFKVGAGMVGAGAAVLGGLGATALAAASFGKSMGEVSTLVDTSAVDMAQLSKSVLGLSAAYGAAPTDTAAALYQTISAGVSDAADATKLLDLANKTAIGGVTDVMTSVDGLTTLMNSYGLSVNEAGILSDQMFLAMKAGKTTIGELSNTLGRVSPVAAALNISSGELLGTISAITTQGIKTSEAVSGLKAALANIVKPTAEATKGWEEMAAGTRFAGKGFDSLTMQAMGLPKFIQMITEVTGGSADQMAKLFGSIEGLNTVLALSGEGAEGWSKILADMKTPVGATEEAYKKMSETFDQQLKVMTQSLHTLVIEIGQAVIPIVRPLIAIFTKLASGIIGFAQAHPTAIKVIVGLVAALGSLLLVGGTVLMALGAIGMLAPAIAGGFALVSGAVAVLSAGFVPAIAGALAFAAALLANPITWIVVGIVALIAGIVLLVKNWDKVTVAMKKAWEWMKSSFMGMWDVVKDAFNKVKKYIPEILAIFFPIIGLPLLIAKHWDKIKDVAKAAFGKAATVIKSVLITIGQFAWDYVVHPYISAWQKVFDFVVSIWSSIKGVVASALNGVVDLVNSVIAKVNKYSKYIGVEIPTIGAISGGGGTAPAEGHATGFEVTKGGVIPGPLHTGEVLMSTDTTNALAGFAKAVSSAGPAEAEKKIEAALAGMTALRAGAGRDLAAAGGATAPAGGPAFTLAQGAVVISFPSVTQVSEIDAEQLVDRIERAIQSKSRRRQEGTYAGEFRPNVEA